MHQMFRRHLAAMLLTACVFHGAASADDLAIKFGARPMVEQVGLSPDGSQVSFIRSKGARGSALMTASFDNPDVINSITEADGDPQRLQWCNWTSNSRVVCRFIGQANDGSNILYFSRIFAVNTDRSNLKMLSTRSTATTYGNNLDGGQIIDWLPEKPGSIIMMRLKLADDRTGSRMGSGENGRNAEIVDTETLKGTLLERPRRENREFITDGHGNIRVRGSTVFKGDGYETGQIIYHYRRKGGTNWERLSELDTGSSTGFNPYAVDPVLDIAYGFDKRDGRMALYKMSLDGALDKELVFAHPKVDVDGLERIGPHRRVVGVSYATDYRSVDYFDEDIAKLRTSLGKALPGKGALAIIDSNLDETRLLIHASSDTHAGTWYVLDRKTKRLSPVLDARPALDGMKMGEMQPIHYPAADGTKIPAYLTMPPNGAKKNLPAIVLPHGGPSARDEWGFDWLTQYFVAKGYAVIQPQFRGSAGYGDQWFRNNGFKNWKVAIGDVNDAGKWLISEGIADPAKLSIVGWSYGGYAALQSAVIEPDLFKSVIAIAPVTDLDRLREQFRGFSDFYQARDFIGVGPHTQEGSPARHASRVKVPVLLFHGSWDANVDIMQSKIMADKLKAAGVPHKLVTWDKLDHYLEDSDVRTQMLTTAGAFLANPASVTGN